MRSIRSILTIVIIGILTLGFFIAVSKAFWIAIPSNETTNAQYYSVSNSDKDSEEEQKDANEIDYTVLTTEDLLSKYIPTHQSMSLSFKDLTLSKEFENSQYTKEFLKYDPRKFGFDHEKFMSIFKASCNESWTEWLDKQKMPTSISIKPDPDPDSNKPKKHRVGVRFVMFEKTEDELVYLIKSAKQERDSMGDISISWTSSNSNLAANLWNIPSGWFYNTMVDEPNSKSFSFEIVDYRSVRFMPVSEMNHRVATKPVEERTTHLVERIIVPLPREAENIILTDSMKAKLAALAPFKPTDHLYFAYTFENPSLNAHNVIVTKDKTKIGSNATFAGRKRSSGSIFYVPYQMTETKMKFRGSQAIYVDIPGDSYLNATFNDGTKTKVKEYTVADFINGIHLNSLMTCHDNKNLKIEENLLSSMEIFGDKPNIFLWRIAAKNGNKSQSFFVEDYDNYPIKNFFELSFDNVDMTKVNYGTVPEGIIKFSFSEIAEKVIKNLYFLHKQYFYIRDHLLKFPNSKETKQILEKLMVDIENCKHNYQGVKKIIDEYKTNKRRLSSYSSPSTPYAQWYVEAKEKLQMNLSKTNITDWPRILTFLAAGIADDLKLACWVDGVPWRLHIIKNGKLQNYHAADYINKRWYIHNVAFNDIYYATSKKSIRVIEVIVGTEKWKKQKNNMARKIPDDDLLIYAAPESEIVLNDNYGGIVAYDFKFLWRGNEIEFDGINWYDAIIINKNLSSSDNSDNHTVENKGYTVKETVYSVEFIFEWKNDIQGGRIELVPDYAIDNVKDMVIKIKTITPNEYNALSEEEKVIFEGIKKIISSKDIFINDNPYIFYRIVAIKNAPILATIKSTTIEHPTRFMWKLGASKTHPGTTLYLVKFKYLDIDKSIKLGEINSCTIIPENNEKDITTRRISIAKNGGINRKSKNLYEPGYPAEEPKEDWEIQEDRETLASNELDDR